MMREKYESLPLATLKDLAKARGLKGISTMKKAELIERMLEEDEKEKKSARETVKELSANTGDKEVHDIDKLDSGITAWASGKFLLTFWYRSMKLITQVWV